MRLKGPLNKTAAEGIAPISWHGLRSKKSADVPTGALASLLLAEGGELDAAAEAADESPLVERFIPAVLRARPPRVGGAGRPASEKVLACLRAIWREALSLELARAWAASTALGRGRSKVRRAWLCMTVLAGPSRPAINEVLYRHYGTPRADDPAAPWLVAEELLQGMTENLGRPGGYTTKDIGRFAGFVPSRISGRELRPHRKIVGRLLRYGILIRKARPGSQPVYEYRDNLPACIQRRMDALYHRRKARLLLGGARHALSPPIGGQTDETLTCLSTYFSGDGFHVVGEKPPDWYSHALSGALDFALMLLWLSIGAPPKHFRSTGDFKPPPEDPLELAKVVDQRYPVALDKLRRVAAALRAGKWVAPTTGLEVAVSPKRDLDRWRRAVLRARLPSVLVGDVIGGTRVFEGPLE